MVKYNRCFLITLFMTLIAWMPVCAEETHPHGIRLDGTIGGAGQLDIPGPDYEIRADYGRQAGANLFHSFGQFNLHTGESATFTGPGSVQNIVSRVTGGNASWIDGTLRSEIQGADLYFLNPAGVMFGKNAALDLSGSFYCATADYLRTENDERFYTEPPANEVLSVAAPAAFGFLNDQAGPVTLEGHGLLTADIWDEDYGTWQNWIEYNSDFARGLRVPEGETISLAAGDIGMTGTYYLYEGDSGGYKTGFVGENLTAPEGEIRLTAVRSPGEVAIKAWDSGFQPGSGGDIVLTDGAGINAEKEWGGAGDIFIRGGRFVADNSEVAAEASREDGGSIT